MKKIINLLTVLAMVICLLPTSTHAENDNADTVTVYSAYLVPGKDEENFTPNINKITVDLGNVKFDESVELKLYSDIKLLTTATLNTNLDIKPGFRSELTGSIKLNGESDYWPYTSWTPLDDVIPTHVEVWIDGVKLDEKQVTLMQGTDGFAEGELTDEKWAALTATVSDNESPELSYAIFDSQVRIYANEKVTLNASGWNKKSEGKEWRKTLEAGKNYTVIATDEYNNSTTLVIDRILPTAEFNYSNNNGNSVTNQNVVVTMKPSEEIRDVEGWSKKDDGTYTKEYSENGKYSVEIIDIVGNKNVLKYEVKRIDKDAPVIKGVENGNRYNKDVIYQVEDKSNNFKHALVNNAVVKENPNTLSEDGSYTLIAVDKAGNESSPIEFVIDKTAPTFHFENTSGSPVASRTVRLVTNEAIKAPDGWTPENTEGTIWVRTFTSNTKIKGFTVTDIAGNVSESQILDVKNVDSTVPTGTVTYSTTEPTNQNVIITLKTNTDCVTPEGWTKVNWRTFTKVYEDNGTYEVSLTSRTNILGNENIVIEITNIDRIAPTVSYGVYSSQVRIFADEAVTLSASHWTEKKGGKEWRRTLEAGKNYILTVTDLAGNSVNLEIDRILPEATFTTSNDGNPTNQDVTVTMTPSESIKDVEGWTNNTIVHTENGIYEVTIIDLVGNKNTLTYTVSGIDKVAPTAEISYSETNPTNKDVTISVKPSETVSITGEGWTYNEENEVYEKVVENNIEEEIVLTDLAGNVASYNVKVVNIDKVNPEYTIVYSTTEKTTENVIVTVTANETINLVGEGWVATNVVNQYQKTFTQNGEEKITIVDEAGNTVEIEVKVDNIVEPETPVKPIQPIEPEMPAEPEQPVEPEEVEKIETHTGDSNLIVPFTGALALSAALLVLLKKREQLIK